MEIEDIRSGFRLALEEFLNKDLSLLKRDVSERSITHRLAVYLEDKFNGFHIDCEYNRNIDNAKLLPRLDRNLTSAREFTVQSNEYSKLPQPEKDGLYENIKTYPDIIVHIREGNENNLLIIEVKKRGPYLNRKTRKLDYDKLKGFTKPRVNNTGYGYRLGLFLVFSRDACVEKIEFVNGEQLNHSHTKKENL